MQLVVRNWFIGVRFIKYRTVPTLASVVCSCGGLLEEGPDDVPLPFVTQQINASLVVNSGDPVAQLRAPHGFQPQAGCRSVAGAAHRFAEGVDLANPAL